MNGKRIILGGLAAGLVMAVLDALTNAVLFKRDWANAYAALHLTPSDGAIGGFWITVDLVCGELIAFLYAAMRPRLGARPRTGLVAATMVWLPLHMALWSHFVDGVFPPRALIGTGVLEFVSASIAGLVAGAIYVEGKAPANAA